MSVADENNDNDQDGREPGAANVRLPPPDAEWDLYWTINHSSLGAFLGQKNAIDVDFDGIVTRKEMYDWEISAGQIPDNSLPDNFPPGDGYNTATEENGNPKYYTGSTPPSAERRSVAVAVVNCVEIGLTDGDVKNGMAVPVKAYARMFITRPVDDPNIDGIWLEMIDVLEAGKDSEVHDIIQLYR